MANGSVARADEGTSPKVRRLPMATFRKYTTLRAAEIVREVHGRDNKSAEGILQSLAEIEAESERQALISATRARIYGSLYIFLGLPAAILAAIAGATALASTTGRLAAGVIALSSSALSAAVIFLDAGDHRDKAAQLNTYWDDLHTDIHVARLTKLGTWTATTATGALDRFYRTAATIRSGGDPKKEAAMSAPSSYDYDQKEPLLFPSSTDMAITPAAGASAGAGTTATIPGP
jgi:hypothetical protein